MLDAWCWLGSALDVVRSDHSNLPVALLVCQKWSIWKSQEAVKKKFELATEKERPAMTNLKELPSNKASSSCCGRVGSLYISLQGSGRSV